MNRRVVVSMITVWALAYLVILPQRYVSSQKPSRQELREQLKVQVAGAHGIPLERLKLADQVTHKHPLTGVTVTEAKFFDTETGEAYSTAVDPFGNYADASTATDNEAAARLSRFGKIDSRLQARLEQIDFQSAIELPGGKAKTIPVSIWLNIPDPPQSRQSGISRAEDASTSLSAHLEEVKQFTSPRRRGVMVALERMGVFAQAPEYGPAVFATLTPEQIRRIARHEEVNMVYLGAEEYSRFNDDSSTTLRTFRVWQGGNLGNLGGGIVRPVVHEDDGVADFNPFLNNATHSVISWCANNACGGKNVSDHATEVAGVIASTHPLFRGIAPSVQLILSANSQNFNDTNLVNAFEWARGNGGDPTNMSWGTDCGGFQTFFSRYVDWAVKNLSATIVTGAGNADGRCKDSSGNVDPVGDSKVSAPGVAWGAITVGSQFDKNNGFWADDGLSTFSRSVNPDFATVMEKPEVVAVGQDIRTTDAQGGDNLNSFGVSGTSFSSPQVAGQVALIISRQASQSTWPETNKATVLASAYHNITSGSDKDGVGSVVMNNSDDTARLGRFFNDANSSGGLLTPGDFPRDYPVPLTANQRVRVAIAWDSNSTGGSGTDVLGADIDLEVHAPDGSLVSEAGSIQNAWEMVEFIAPVTGTYTFRAPLFRSDAGWPGTYMGMAYSIRSLPDFCSGVSTGTGTFNINTANGPTWFDSYAGWSLPQTGREYVRKIVLSSTKDINVSIANPNLNVHLIQISSCSANPLVPTVIQNGFSALTANNAPAGSYYVVVDGFNGAVGTDTLSISLTGP